ncbi:MAG: M15 family metallopeptidase [Cyanobacteria bacterium J06632_3]
MSTPPPKDVPPARRQSSEISMAEIENLQLKPQPRKRSGVKGAIAFLLLAGLGGMGYWQWPWIKPRLESARAAVTETSFNVLGSRSPAAQGPADGAIAASRQGSDSGQENSSADLPRNVTDSIVVPPINSRPVPVEADESNPANGPTVSDVNGPDELLNHRRYEVANEESLVSLNPYSEIRLKPDAQEAVTQMIAQANSENVQLGVISGFRTLADQDYLYFGLKAERGQSARTRAEVSAPPGYSEHHTGYAVDFIDEDRSETHLIESFENTPAFKWLEDNAAYYSFEMSFPKDNSSNVSYEPWHWRYVGNQESLELFYK